MNDEPTREISQQYDRWWAALPAHDERTLDELLANDWTYIDQFGAVRNKADYIALVKQAIRPDHSTVTVTLDARRYGGVAVATGRYDVRGIIDGNHVDIQLRFTSVWQHDNNQWICHTQHTTEIRDAPW
jgi:ketosteroid isomerase-like protein